jgi:hypothetical protein
VIDTLTSPETASPADGHVAMPRLGVLYSYEQGPVAAERGLDFARRLGLRSILDSGAWSVFNAKAVIDIDQHAAYVNRLAPSHPLTRFVALDVIGDEEASYRNWLHQRELGCPVEPTVHYGSNPMDVDRYVNGSATVPGLAINGAGEYWLNCGGMVAASSRPSMIRPTMAWVAAVKRRLPPEVKIHGLGMTTPLANDMIKFDSVDSTYWLVSLARFRTLPIFNPEKREWDRVTLLTKTKAHLEESKATFAGLGPLLRKHYNTTPRELWDMTEAERFGLSIKSHALFVDTYRARHASDTAPIAYLAGAPTSETASNAGLMDEILLRA